MTLSNDHGGWAEHRRADHVPDVGRGRHSLPALGIAALLLLAPPGAAAVPAASGEQEPAQARQAAPVPMTTPASQPTPALPPGSTTTGRPATLARPAPSAGATQPAAAPADGRLSQVVVPGSAVPTSGGLLQTIFALVLVLGLLMGLAWFMKRFGPRAMGANANVKLVGTLHIGGRERIMVVEVGDQWIVVGASPGRVNALATMPRREGTQAQDVLAAQSPGAASFGDWLKKTIDNRHAK